MTLTTPKYALPYPQETDSADVPRDVQALAQRIEAVLPNVGIPTGGGMDWYAPAAPAGFLLCDGSAVNRTTYAALFAVLGTTWGGGDGINTFNLPDTRGRVIVGLAPGGHADVATLGNNDGNGLSTRRPRHAHNVNDPTHAHSISDPGHNHTVNDPWHVHSIGAGPNGQPVGGSSADWQNGYGPTNTNAAPTNIWLSPAVTGIGIYGAATGITVGVGGGGTDTPSYVVAAKVVKT